MTGKYEVIVRNRRIQYKFVINRNITILRGDSATGKTTLIDMIAAHQVSGLSSGVEVLCMKKCCVLTAMNWENALSQIKDSIVFIDEDDDFVKSKEFSQKIKEADNYYVIAIRNPLSNIPYSINEIYGIKNTSGNRYQGTKRIYSEFYQLYNKEKFDEMPSPDVCIVEDSNSGYDFFDKVCKEHNIRCISAEGKSNIFDAILECDEENIMIIADGAAFGPEIEKVLSLKKIKNLTIFLPESFEWLILKSGLIEGVGDEIDNPNDYIDSSQYFSWERFFTALLVDKSKGTYLAYSKKKLNVSYLQDKEKTRIMKNVKGLDG